MEEARPVLQARISHNFEHADVAALEAALARLPTDRPALTDALVPADFLHWLERYEAHDTSLEELVTLVRALEPMFPG